MKTSDLSSPPASAAERVAHAIAVSALFLVFYGGTNAFTATRHDVHACFAPWELKFIPLVPAMLIPYLSCDLFFVASFFVCRSRRELWTLSLRLTTCILVGAVCFILFPLKLMYPPQQVGGIAGAVLRFLGSSSQYNLAPSLHIALGFMLYAHFASRVRGVLWKVSLGIWFILIGASTLLTHQHHVIDLPAGAMLAALVAWMWPRSRRVDVPRFGEVRRVRVAVRYATGALACMGIAMIGGTWWWLMLWPAVSLAIVAIAYAGAGPGVYRKQADGTMSIGASVVVAPVIIGTWLWRLPWLLSAPGPVQVAPGVYVGPRRSGAIDARDGCSVLDLTSEVGETAVMRTSNEYRNVPMLDRALPTRAQMNEAVEFVRSNCGAGRKVYVHCALGYSRSVAVAAAYWCMHGTCPSSEQAVDEIMRARGRARVDRLTRESATVVQREGKQIRAGTAPWPGAARPWREAQPGREVGSVAGAVASGAASPVVG